MESIREFLEQLVIFFDDMFRSVELFFGVEDPPKIHSK